MAMPNENGVYEPQFIEELARHGRAYASVEIAQCTDGLYRFALDMMASTCGFSGPITARGTGYVTAAFAKQEATFAMLGRFPKPSPMEPGSVHAELTELRRQIEQKIMQPSLF